MLCCNNARNYITKEIIRNQFCNVKNVMSSGKLIRNNKLMQCNNFGLNGTEPLRKGPNKKHGKASRAKVVRKKSSRISAEPSLELRCCNPKSQWNRLQTENSVVNNNLTLPKRGEAKRDRQKVTKIVKKRGDKMVTKRWPKQKRKSDLSLWGVY